MGSLTQENKVLSRQLSKLKHTIKQHSSTLELMGETLKSGNSQELDDLIGQLRQEGKDTKTLQKVAAALKTPIQTKEKNFFKDDITLLAIDLQNQGVPQGAVRSVVSSCCKVLGGRTLDSLPSRRTAGRMVRRGGILSDFQVATCLNEAAERGRTPQHVKEWNMCLQFGRFVGRMDQ